VPGKRLADARKRNQLTQKELANTTGIPHHRLARLERNQASPRISEIQKLCTTLNMSADWWLRNDTAPADVLKRKIDKMNTDKRRLLLTIFDLMS